MSAWASIDLDGYGTSLLEGLSVTAGLAISAMALASVLGGLVAWASLSRSPAARGLARLYLLGTRGIPDYVLLLIVYFGGGALWRGLFALIGCSAGAYLDAPFAAAITTLGIVFGTYMAESIRGAWLAIPRGQIEAAVALGIPRRRLLLRIVAPPLLFHGLPAFSNVWLILVKSTAIASLIGLNDVLRRAQGAASVTQEPFKFYLAVSLAFLLITSASNHVAARLIARISARL